MNIYANSQCLLCHLKKNVELARSLGSEEQATRFAKALMQVYLSAPEDVSSPWFVPEANRLLGEFYGMDPDRFREEMDFSNAFVLARLDQIRSKIRSASDPVFAGLQFSILGNYIDFSALNGEVSFEKLENMLDSALEMELDKDCYRSFCADLEKGQKLLYLTDNAGEIGFDRLFAEEIQKRYPDLAITFCVRGGPANNDATRQDAQAVGIPFRVIDSGNCIPGTQIDALGEEAKKAFQDADVILAKGQGNAETLLGCGYNVYYAFLVKCQLFMDRFQKPKLTPMLVKEKH